MTITQLRGNFEREPLRSPFGFKGRYVRETWHTAVRVRNPDGEVGVGLGLQSPLWSDAAVFARYGERASNALMYLLTEEALRLLEGQSFAHPPEAIEALLPAVASYAHQLTGRGDLRPTFVLNSLVPVDLALWQLYARERHVATFSDIVPRYAKDALAHRHDRLASVPLVTYGTSLASVRSLVDQGHFFLKVKVGSDPDGDGNPEKMIDWDTARVLEIHRLLKDRRVPHTEDGRIPYYLDANGRYGTKEILQEFVRRADAAGYLDRILLFEEPFPESYHEPVHDIPLRLVADESAHSVQDVEHRAELGYGAIALKPIAKTLSVTFQMLDVVASRGLPSFCADLTVNPTMVEWNRNVAARLAPLPTMNVGVLETNGRENYVNWEQMRRYHPRNDEPWTRESGGIFELTEEFYAAAGGIFQVSPHYAELAE